MKMKLKIVLLILVFPVVTFAQLDCSSFFKYRKPEKPYEYNSQSKSAVCVTGNTYEFVISLYEGHEYRMSFYASPVFNNDMTFKIVDMNTTETVLNLPGESETNEKGTCALKAYFDLQSGQSVQPFFDFYPSSTTNLKIIIEIADLGESSSSDGEYVSAQQEKGCVTVLILDTEAAETGF